MYGIVMKIFVSPHKSRKIWIKLQKYWAIFKLKLIEHSSHCSEKEASLDKQAKERPSLFQMAGGSREEDEIDDGGNICITPSSSTRSGRTWK